MALSCHERSKQQYFKAECVSTTHTTIPTINTIGSEYKVTVHCGSAVRFGRAFPGFLITTPCVCVPDVIGVLAVCVCIALFYETNIGES